MRVFVLGSTGMLGHTVVKYLSARGFHVAPVSKDTLNVLWDTDIVTATIKSWNITDEDYVINCIGAIPQRQCYDPAAVWEINAVFPRSLAYDYDIKHVIQISTDCVFTGDRGPYNEYCAPDADDPYGISKINGEVPTHAMVLRTSLIGPEIMSRAFGLYDKFVKNQAVSEGYLNHYWNGVTTLQMAKTLESIMEEEQFQIGVMHVHSPHVVSKYDLLQHIGNSKWDVWYHEDVTPVMHPQTIDRTLKSIWPTLRSIPSIPQQLKELKEFER